MERGCLLSLSLQNIHPYHRALFEQKLRKVNQSVIWSLLPLIDTLEKKDFMPDNREGKMPAKTSKGILFKELTWDDLEEWVGSRVLSRGQSYRSHREELVQTRMEGLIAGLLQARYAHF
jgi:hypothetical protein